VTTSNPLTFEYQSHPQRVIFGAGRARSDLAGEVERLAGTRVLVIAGGSALALAGELTGTLPVVATFSGVQQHVPVEVAEAVRALAAQTRADLLLCIGGGSTTGTAKAVALTTGLPILAIPTTYAGSEATPIWGLTEDSRKRTGTDSRVLPRTVLYDPDLTSSLPVELTVASGLNALAHSVDAMWAPLANPVSTALAAAGIRALAEALPAVRREVAGARADALYGAYLAAVAFAGAGSGLHHKICHVLGGAYGLPHAPMHAVVLPHVLAFNTPAAPAAAREIAAALRKSEPVSKSGPEAALDGLLALYAEIEAPRSLRELGLAESDLAEAAVLVARAAPPSNPRPFGPDQARQLLQQAWAGDRPSPIHPSSLEEILETAQEATS
jgi:alcohol dehydrogenase class IV